MKTVAVFLSVCFCAAIDAGHPDEDPAVAKLRRQFAAAKSPVWRDLRLGRAWACREHFALRGNPTDYQSSRAYVFFQRVPGEWVENRGTYKVRKYHLSEDKMHGYSQGYVSAIRMAVTGELVTEWSSPPDWADEPAGLFMFEVDWWEWLEDAPPMSCRDASLCPPSLAIAGNRVISYGRCSPAL